MNEPLPGSPPEHDSPQRNSMLGAAFPATQWSTVFRAQKDDAEAARALNDLCRRYWYPLYAYLRCRNISRSDAQDITQTFFMRAVSGDLLKHADPARGKLRSFLLGALTRQLADHVRHELAQKRGGRAIVLPLECENAEDRFANEPRDYRDPETLFCKAWARSLIDRVRDKVRQHYERTHRKELYELLQGAIELDDSAAPYRDLAVKLQTSETALRLQVFRMRQRFAALMREEIAATVDSPEEVEEELAWLSKILRGDL